MAEKITPRSEDFSQWYIDIVTQAQLADYSPVKGCMVIRPKGFAIWERIQRELDDRIKATGHENAYFPLFIPEAFLKKEADHVEGFSPECAVVTHGGGKKLEEPLVVRPTSETIINAMFSKWIMSYRDLPLLINQWANVVRWEMRTRLFLRTTEFLWQEGHTCHADEAEAQEEALKMLEVYREFCETVMAVPLVTGRKTATERFAGAVETYTIEAMMQDNKALQAGTSHYLGENFARAFETRFQDKDGELRYVHQTSWGVSTRLVGALIMTHSDDKGLVLPPNVAPTQVVFVPILKKNADSTPVLEAVGRLADELKGVCSVKVDDRLAYTPGWKFHEYEMLGVPIRIELGPRDLEASTVMMARRDTGEKSAVPFDKVAAKVPAILADIQDSLYKRALERLETNTRDCDEFETFKALVDDPGGFIRAHWCGNADCEAAVKEQTKATIRCIPTDNPQENGACVLCGKPSVERVIFAKAY